MAGDVVVLLISHNYCARRCPLTSIPQITAADIAKRTWKVKGRSHYAVVHNTLWCPSTNRQRDRTTRRQLQRPPGMMATDWPRRSGFCFHSVTSGNTRQTVNNEQTANDDVNSTYAAFHRTRELVITRW